MDSKNLPITGPCPIDLDAIGFDRSAKRSHCGHCDKSVHVLSNMTEREARAFMTRNAGKNLCVSYARTQDGTVQFKPEPATQIVPLTRLSRRPAAAAAGLGLAMALAACTPYTDPTQNVVGEMVSPKIETVEGGVQMQEPCDKPKTPVTDREPHEMIAGDMWVPPSPPETEMFDGELEVQPPEPGDGDVQARGSRQVVHFDD